MSAFVERGNVSLIERGGADDTAQFLYRIWLENKGMMPPSSELMKVSPFLVIFDDYCSSSDSPDILFYGSQTLFSDRYPEAEECDEANPKQLLNEDYRHLVCAGYQDALGGEPVFETVGTGGLLGPRKPEIIYDRVVLRFRKKVGSYLISYTIKRDEKWLYPRSNRSNLIGCSQQKPSYHLSYQAEQTNEFRPNEPT